MSAHRFEPSEDVPERRVDAGARAAVALAALRALAAGPDGPAAPAEARSAEDGWAR